MTEILLLLCFQLKHFLVDFVWQSDKQLEAKSIYGKLAGLEHAGLHALFTYLILVHFLDIGSSITLALIDFVLHYHIDWARLHISKRNNLTAGDSIYIKWLGFDQFLHQLTYLVIVIISSILIGEYING